MKKYLIYALTDPRTNEIRYVGKSESGLRRPRAHRCPSNHTKTHCSRWIAELTTAGLTYGIQVLEEVTAADLLDVAECRWIARLRTEGCPLTNITDGGGGTRGWRWTDEQRQRQSDRLRGRPLSEDTRQRLSAAQTGHQHSTETLAKMSATRKGRTPSAEHRTALAHAGMGHPVSDEARAKMAAAKQGKKRSRESVEASARGLRGHIVSEETKAKIAEAQRKRHAAKRDQKLEPIDPV